MVSHNSGNYRIYWVWLEVWTDCIMPPGIFGLDRADVPLSFGEPSHSAPRVPLNETKSQFVSFG